MIDSASVSRRDRGYHWSESVIIAASVDKESNAIHRSAISVYRDSDKRMPSVTEDIEERSGESCLSHSVKEIADRRVRIIACHIDKYIPDHVRPIVRA